MIRLLSQGTSKGEIHNENTSHVGVFLAAGVLLATRPRWRTRNGGAVRIYRAVPTASPNRSRLLSRLEESTPGISVPAQTGLDPGTPPPRIRERLAGPLCSSASSAIAQPTGS